MIFYNINNMTVYLYGLIVEPNSIFKIDNHDQLFSKIREKITLKDAIKILNNTFIPIEPMQDDDKHYDIVSICKEYNEVVVKEMVGSNNIILDNISYSVADFNKFMLNKNIDNDSILILDNANIFNVGLY